MRPIKAELLSSDLGSGAVALEATASGRELKEVSACVKDVSASEFTVTFDGTDNFELGQFKFELTVNGETVPLKLSRRRNVVRLIPQRMVFLQCLHEAEIYLSVWRELDEYLYGCRCLVESTAEGAQKEDRDDLLKIEAYVRRYAAFFISNSRNLFETDGEEKVKKAGIALKRYREIADLYNRHVHYFRTNARFKLSSQESVEPFNRIRSFSESTLRYIISHPYELVPVQGQKGIPYRGTVYTPLHTMVKSKIKNFDIYENKVILGFLKAVCTSAEEELRDEPQLRKHLGSLLSAYEKMLSLSAKVLRHIPKPTPVLTSVAAYRPFYQEIQNWFQQDQNRESQETFILEACSKGRLYEYYCLLRILRQKLKEGWTYQSSERIDWRCFDPYYKRPSFDNCFAFTKEGRALDVFFEPVVWSNKPELNERLGLYRSSSAKIARKSLIITEDATGYYLPDYVVRETLEDGSRVFEIADAKFSDQTVVVSERLTDLIFKYRLGMTPIRSEDRIASLTIFCGKGGAALQPFGSIPNPITQERNELVQLVNLNERGSAE